jgi:hypothetical protein
LFARTPWNASQTTRFEILNGFALPKGSSSVNRS